MELIARRHSLVSRLNCVTCMGGDGRQWHCDVTIPAALRLRAGPGVGLLVRGGACGGWWSLSRQLTFDRSAQTPRTRSFRVLRLSAAPPPPRGKIAFSF
ncbi:hypothetical protein NDU88_006747 [Pleurodeles waltl]|uniref:Uncharacterized protein n=1 Tax=Pleurodeles waltl TaxID=8319 RepID=A0AAV7MDQ3_PLEWA|nr:hypothetical protein NDU88_006747 [Pleurodeles waltl]